MKKIDVLIILILIIFYGLTLSGTLRTASVEGVSMYPIFQNGYMVFYAKPDLNTIHIGRIWT